MKTVLFWLLLILMTFLFFGGIYWGINALNNPQRALAMSMEIGAITQQPYFIPIIIGSALLIILSVLIPILFRSGNQNQLRKRLLVEGISTNAEIIRIADTGITFNKNPRVKLTVAILDCEASFEITVSRVSIPRVGDWIAVIYDPNDPTKATPLED